MTSVPAYPVAPGRCPHCGCKKTTWEPGSILEAVRTWTAEHGEPPRVSDWSRGTPDHPAQASAQIVFGSWNRMIAAAGLPIRPKCSPTYWTRELIIDAMTDWLFRHGRWPQVREWYDPAIRGDGAPHSRTVVKVFGSWNAAKRAAGWRPKHEIESQWETYKAAQRRNAARRKAERKAA